MNLFGFYSPEAERFYSIPAHMQSFIFMLIIIKLCIYRAYYKHTHPSFLLESGKEVLDSRGNRAQGEVAESIAE